MTPTPKTTIHLPKELGENPCELPVAISLNIGDVVDIRHDFYIVHHKLYQVDSDHLVYWVGSRSESHPQCREIEAGW
jgi:hypothetical protein